MTTTVPTSAPLTESERQKLAIYAEALIAQRSSQAGVNETSYLDAEAIQGLFNDLNKPIDVDAVPVLLKGLEQSSVDIVHQASEAMLRKYDPRGR